MVRVRMVEGAEWWRGRMVVERVDGGGEGVDWRS
jgi:hypothetical protein